MYVSCFCTIYADMLCYCQMQPSARDHCYTVLYVATGPLGPGCRGLHLDTHFNMVSTAAGVRC